MREPTEMELRAAQALAVARGCRWERCSDNDREMVIEEARAAIRAMREPTRAMRDDGAAEFYGFNPEWNSPSEYITDAWAAMIDAASPPEV